MVLGSPEITVDVRSESGLGDYVLPNTITLSLSKYKMITKVAASS